jgi:hypothetical protein
MGGTSTGIEIPLGELIRAAKVYFDFAFQVLDSLDDLVARQHTLMRQDFVERVSKQLAANHDFFNRIGFFLAYCRPGS